MRRMLMLLTVALAMAATLAFLAAPAFARASENASCVGQGVTFFNGISPGAGGRFAALAAQSTVGTPGPGLSDVARDEGPCL